MLLLRLSLCRTSALIFSVFRAPKGEPRAPNGTAALSQAWSSGIPSFIQSSHRRGCPRLRPPVWREREARNGTKFCPSVMQLDLANERVRPAPASVARAREAFRGIKTSKSKKYMSGPCSLRKQRPCTYTVSKNQSSPWVAFAPTSHLSALLSSSQNASSSLPAAARSAWHTHMHTHTHTRALELHTRRFERLETPHPENSCFGWHPTGLETTWVSCQSK